MGSNLTSLQSSEQSHGSSTLDFVYNAITRRGSHATVTNPSQAQSAGNNHPRNNVTSMGTSRGDNNAMQQSHTYTNITALSHNNPIPDPVDVRALTRPLSDTNEIRLRIEDVQRRNTANCPASFAGLKIIAIAIYDYRATVPSDISFFKGDRFLVLDDSEGDWWKVRHLRTGREGYIPINFIAEDMSIESEDWFFGEIGRKEAERLLMSEENERGTFLLRNSEHGRGKHLSLSVKSLDEEKLLHVKHYKIKQTSTGKYYLSDTQLFADLQHLVSFYKMLNLDNGAPGLVTPCPKPEPQIWDLSPQFRDQWEIDRSDIDLRRKIGQGKRAEVWLGTFKENKTVAVKIFHPGTKKTREFLKEAAIMKKFRHDRLIQMYAVCSKKEPIWIVLEYMKKGSLLKYLIANKGFLKFTDQIYIAEQIASGMKYLEEKQYIHQNLSAKNILVGDNNVVKICDFGQTRLIDDIKYTTGQRFKLEIRWTAPECFEGKIKNYTLKSDVWSYGIVVMEIFTYGELPYRNFDKHEVKRRLALGYRLPKTKDMPDHVYQVLRQCWDVSPDQRPTFRYLKQYFEDCDFATENVLAISSQFDDAEDFSAF